MALIYRLLAEFLAFMCKQILAELLVTLLVKADHGCMSVLTSLPESRIFTIEAKRIDLFKSAANNLLDL